MDAQWFFNQNTNFDDWVVTADSDHNEGHSTCSFGVSPVGKGLFSGNLSTQLVKDGKIKNAGYCNIKSIRPLKSFKRDSFHDWSAYTHLVLRVRGDGRSYMINLGSAGYFDINWNDQFHFALYTRGGPHWQVSKVSFLQNISLYDHHLMLLLCADTILKIFHDQQRSCSRSSAGCSSQ